MRFASSLSLSGNPQINRPLSLASFASPDQLDHPPYFFDIKEHHLYHAITAFYFSKFEEATAIVIDGGGSCKFYIPYQEVESVYEINNKKIIPTYKHSSAYRLRK